MECGAQIEWGFFEGEEGMGECLGGWAGGFTCLISDGLLIEATCVSDSEIDEEERGMKGSAFFLAHENSKGKGKRGGWVRGRFITIC